MKFYLSSYKLGNKVDKLKEITAKGNKRVAFISNALDFSSDFKRREKSEERDINDFKKLGFKVNIFDLRKYFNNNNLLEKDLKQYDNIWVKGGNVFVLRQAMKLSGFDDWLIKKSKEKNNLVYGGYSAGPCVLSPTLKGLELVDDISQKPYSEQEEIIYKGLNIIDYQFVPHYKSEGHPETEAMNKVVDFYIKNKFLFKALTDGEVIVIE